MFFCHLNPLSVLCLSASDVVSLNSGSSSLVYRLSPGSRQLSRDVVSLKFKTLRNSGTLLHAEGEGGLSLSLELERGKLQLLLRQGTTQHILNILISTASKEEFNLNPFTYFLQLKGKMRKQQQPKQICKIMSKLMRRRDIFNV